jgi:geranylgeranyl pyrophosphate synthase
MSEMNKYDYADLTKEQEQMLKNTEVNINKGKESSIYLMAFKKGETNMYNKKQ